MAQTREFSGKNIDIAIKNACSELTISKEKLKYDIISEGTSGIFGIVGRKDAKIRVRVPDEGEQTAAQEEMEGIKSIVDEAFGEDTRLEDDPAPKPVKKASKPRGKKAPKNREKAPKARDTKESSDTPKSSDAPKSGDASKSGDAPKSSDKPKAYVTPDPVDVTQDSITLGTEALQKMADLITEDARVSANTEKDRLTLSIEGGNTGILIGRKGQTLDAMQFLTDKIINRKSEDRVRVRVDIEGYMETRKTNLRHLAFKMADKAKKTGRPATINQMSAQDRRIVHLALKEDNKVRTQSMGDGYYRRLVIFPKKKNSFRGKKRRARS